MPGLDRNRVVGKTYEELVQFTCNICLMLFTDPMVTQCCRQLYCKQCISEWLKNHDICPFDRQPLTTEELSSASRPFVNLLNEVKVKCDYHFKGCSATPILEKLNEHTMSCEFNLCPSCGLRENDLRNMSAKVNALKREIDSIKRESNHLKRSLAIAKSNNSAFRLRILLALITIFVLSVYSVMSIIFFNVYCNKM